MSYDYAARTVWLEDLHDDDHPATHDLCPRHADRLTPPMGWELVDRRGGRLPVRRDLTAARTPLAG